MCSTLCSSTLRFVIASWQNKQKFKKYNCFCKAQYISLVPKWKESEINKDVESSEVSDDVKIFIYGRKWQSGHDIAQTVFLLFWLKQSPNPAGCLRGLTSARWQQQNNSAAKEESQNTLSLFQICSICVITSCQNLFLVTFFFFFRVVFNLISHCIPTSVHTIVLRMFKNSQGFSTYFV